jgi:hypothetical protein
MPKYALKKTATPSKKGVARASKGGVSHSTISDRFLSSSEDVAEFEAAARAYTKEHAESKATALKALRKMGMVTAAGRLTKRYS